MKGKAVAAMNTTILWGIPPFLDLVGTCFFLWLDQRSQKREGGQGIVWYRRILFVGACLFLIPLLGIYLPEIIISLVVFHGFILPSTADFDYQLFTHSLSFFTWLAIFAYGVDFALVIYIACLGFIGVRRL